ncbi:MAG: sugar phosphate isomerase/epimerase [Armatimonadia bacterium]
MKLCGHTMGMPGLTLLEALHFCRDLGLDGIEIRCAANGHLNPETVTDAELALIAKTAADEGVAIACLTPYYKDYTSPQATAETLEGLRKTCRAAQLLGCSLVRATGGMWPLPATNRDATWADTALGLQQASALAADYGVKLALENHSGTLTQTAEDTVAMVLQVARPNFGILMDHYWVVAAGREDPLQAVRLQAPHVLHVHCKNLIRVDGKPLANFLDEGEIDWQPILQILKDQGYTGYLSDEYEKFWRPELPEPQIGMKRNANHLRSVLSRLT